MEYTYVPASQIPPISGFELPTSLKKINDEASNFFYGKGLINYKIFKNAYASSVGISKNSKEFIDNFFDVLEASLKIQLKENGNDAEQIIAVRETFNIIKSIFKVLDSTGIKIDTMTFFATVVGYILGKMR